MTSRYEVVGTATARRAWLPRDVVSHDGDVPPWGGVPVGIVVTLFRAFVTPPCASRVLSRILRRLTFEFLMQSHKAYLVTTI